MNFSALILAAGNSIRFGEDKILFRFEDKETLIEKTINIFLNNNYCKEIVVATTKSRADFIKEKFKNVKVIIVDTKYREETTKLGLEQVTFENVLIHDAARCFTQQDIINKVAKKLKTCNAVVPIRYATSTHHIIRNNFIFKLVKRNELAEVQTPQGFKTKEIKSILENSDLTATDESTIYFKMNKKIHVVETKFKNIKITTKEDV